MTRIKLCGLTRVSDVEAVNAIRPEYIGFVFYPKSKRNISREDARNLKAMLDPAILAVGVFVDKDMDEVASLLEEGIIDMAQLHGKEDSAYILKLKEMTGKPVIKAFTIKGPEDVTAANQSLADYVLVDSGKGSGITFAWELLKKMERPYFLAGGLNLDNAREAIETTQPFALDVSSGIETEGKKDPEKMRRFAEIVRNIEM